MPKYKAGLHKEISSIFDGVPMPKDNDVPCPPDVPTPEHPDYEGRPKQDPALRQPDEGRSGGLQSWKKSENGIQSPAPPKVPAPSQSTAPAPKPQQPQLSPPQAAAPKKPRAATINAPRQIPGQQVLEQIKNKLFAPKPGVSAARQKTIVILIPVLFVILIFVFIRAFSTPSRATATTVELGPTKAVAAPIKIDWQIPAPYSATFRDPMQFDLATITQGGTGRLIVKGIVYSDDKPTAVIGTQIVHEGDKVLGATVVKINKDSVEFKMNGEKWTQKVQ